MITDYWYNSPSINVAEIIIRDFCIFKRSHFYELIDSVDDQAISQCYKVT